ncbi:helix-turn-helix domain-containing protein [Haloprofundus halobius]|uniref:helix-turn-helix domain-containing protein n=1 Tax=Haloprofundus halobius TaxID=2876194 RepID=UPI001CCB4E61|nr:helix-turn-helix domain-containing protein [Haloprofundus halobius]
MSLIAIASVSHPDLALVPTIRAVRDVSVQVVPHSTTDSETGMFFFLVEAEDGEFGEFDSALEADDTVSESLLIAESNATRIYRLRHTDGAILLSPETTKVGGLMLEAKSDEQGWTVRLHLPDREALAELWEFCGDRGISFELYRLFRQDEWTVGGPTGVTDAQREALVAAYEDGYFEEPRETSLEDLAAELDISPTAMGGRLRRGTGKLIESTLVDE